MKQLELAFFSACALIVLAAPFLPTQILLSLDYLVIRLLLVTALLYMIRMGTIPALFCFMAVAVLFVERNRRKVSYAQKALDEMDSSKPSTPSPIADAFIAPSTIHPAVFNTPASTETGYLPIREMDTAAFEAVADTINEKVVLESVYRQGSAIRADLFEDFGVGHLYGVKTVEDQDV